MQLPPANHRRWRSRYQEPPQAEVSQRRFLLLKALVLLLFGVLTVQLARMQLVEHDQYEAEAEDNRLRQVLVLPARGHISDRHGEPLVQNEPIFSAGVVPADVPDDQLLTLASDLSELIGVDAEKIATQIVEARKNDDPFIPIVIKEDLTNKTAFRLRERQAELPGVQVLVESIRSYPSGALTSHLLGYVGRIGPEEYAELRDEGYQLNDRLGKAGVEFVYESVLRGRPGYDLVEVDAAGRRIRTVQSSPPQPAGNLVLSLDLDLQRKVTELLREAKRDSDSRNAVAAVMNVQSGEVLSMVSLPSYDNNLLTVPVDQEAYAALLNIPAKPLVNHAIAEMFAPGSTFKMVTGTAALQEGVARPSTTITSHGYITVPLANGGAEIFRDWRAHGTLDFYGGLAWSSDVYYYQLAGGYYQNGEQVFQGLGPDRLARYAREYGLGEPTGIDLPGESSGLVPDPAWEEQTIGDAWTIGDTYHFGIGQGYLAVTPLQLMRVTAAVANGGDVLVPHLVREVVDDEGNTLRRVRREVSHEVPISDENLIVMREALRQAADYGTAQSGASRFVAIGGKTGTAEFGPQLSDGSYETHAWYTGFAPFEQPEIAVVVFLEKGGGGANAGPVAREIFDYYFGRKLFAQEQRP